MNNNNFNPRIMEVITQALEFENRKLSLKSTNDRILASREVKALILNLNEIYKVNNDQAIMDLMKRLTAIKRKVESRLKSHITI